MNDFKKEYDGKMTDEQRKVYVEKRIEKMRQGICPECGSLLKPITGVEYHHAAAGDTGGGYQACTQCRFKCMN